MEIAKSLIDFVTRYAEKLETGRPVSELSNVSLMRANDAGKTSLGSALAGHASVAKCFAIAPPSLMLKRSHQVPADSSLYRSLARYSQRKLYQEVYLQHTRASLTASCSIKLLPQGGAYATACFCTR